MNKIINECLITKKKIKVRETRSIDFFDFFKKNFKFILQKNYDMKSQMVENNVTRCHCRCSLLQNLFSSATIFQDCNEVLFLGESNKVFSHSSVTGLQLF